MFYGVDAWEARFLDWEGGQMYETVKGDRGHYMDEEAIIISILLDRNR